MRRLLSARYQPPRICDETRVLVRRQQAPKAVRQHDQQKHQISQRDGGPAIMHRRHGSAAVRDRRQPSGERAQQGNGARPVGYARSPFLRDPLFPDRRSRQHTGNRTSGIRIAAAIQHHREGLPIIAAMSKPSVGHDWNSVVTVAGDTFRQPQPIRQFRDRAPASRGSIDGRHDGQPFRIARAARTEQGGESVRGRTTFQTVAHDPGRQFGDGGRARSTLSGRCG